MEQELQPSARARAAVAAFLRGSSSESEGGSASDSCSDSAAAARPSRLGLGATPTHAVEAGESAAARARARLQRSLRAQRARADDDDGDSGTDDSSADESRTRVIGRRGRKRKRAPARTDIVVGGVAAADGARKRAAPGAGGTHGAVENLQQPDGAATAGLAAKKNHASDIAKKGHAPDVGTQARHLFSAVRKEGMADGAQDRVWQQGNAAVTGAVGGIKRKRTKTRSRQKNLKRDKRASHQRPAHLTEETLLAGRMPAHNGAPTSF